MTQSTTADYTPGPWFIAPPGGPQGPFYGMVNPQGNVVATQIVGPANARLIAAAPDLLQACRAALWAMTPHPIHSCAGNDMKRADDDNAFDSLKRAIAKAEGRQL